MERGQTTILVVARRGETQLFVQEGFEEFGYLNEFEQLEVAAASVLRLLAEKSAQQGNAAELLPPLARDIEDNEWVKGTQIP